jgi:hypothetical protein
MCPHGGTVSALSGNHRVTAAGSPILRASDTYTIGGCPLVIGNAPHPCVTVQWVQAAAQSQVIGDLTLTAESVGVCKAADQAVQGTVIVVFTQARASGR